jgi:nucleoid-associated protein YejK
MEDTPSSRGGFIITMDYKSSNNNRYFFIALLNNKENFSISDSLEIVKNLTLNIDKMAMASVINISRYIDGQDNYITFLRGLRDIPDYFISFIGANKDRKKDIREVTKSWLDAIEQFYENQELSPESIEDRAKSMITQIKNLNRNEEIITAEILANIIYPENPESFIEFAFNEDSSFELPSEMDRLDTQVLNELSTVSYINKAKGFTLKFKRKDIGTLINYDGDRVIINDREIVDAIQRVIENE